MTPDLFALQLTYSTTTAVNHIWYMPVVMPGTYRVEKLYWVSDTALTANATDYTTISVDIGANEIATEATTVADLGSLTAGTPVELALKAGSAKNAEIAQGSAIKVSKTDSGAGLALNQGGQFTALLRKIRA